MSITNQPQVPSVTPTSVSAKPRLPQPDPGFLSLKRARLIVGAAIAAIAWWQGAAPGIAAEPAKKLHLMYLVTAKADDLKPGSVVAVEPAFFTDGEEIVFVYDYCTAYLEFIKTGTTQDMLTRDAWMIELKKQKKLAGDLHSLVLWCQRRDPNLAQSWSIPDKQNEPFHAEVKPLAGMDHEGAQIRLASLEFVNYDKTGKGTLAGITHPEGGNAVLPGDRQYRFFLLGADAKLVNRLVPVWKVKSPDAQALLDRLNAVKDEVKWTTHTPCRPLRQREWCQDGKRHPNTDPVQMASSFNVYLEKETPIIVAGLRSLGLGPSQNPIAWQGSVIVRQKGDTWVRGATMGIPDGPWWPSIDGYAASLFLPKLVLRVGHCNYLIMNTGVDNSIDLFALPDRTAQCPHREALKFHEDPGGDGEG